MNEAQQGVTIAVVIVLVAAGVLVFAAGVVNFIRARRAERLCSEYAHGCVVDMVDRGPGVKRRLKRDEKDLEVDAPNEAIAAKKRAYRQKKREQAQRENREGIATWHPVVEWTPQGADQPVRTESARGHRARAMRRGQDVRVWYNPADPDQWYLEEEGTGLAVGPTLMIAGAGLAIVGVICWFAFPWIASNSL